MHGTLGGRSGFGRVGDHFFNLVFASNGVIIEVLRDIERRILRNGTVRRYMNDNAGCSLGPSYVVFSTEVTRREIRAIRFSLRRVGIMRYRKLRGGSARRRTSVVGLIGDGTELVRRQVITAAWGPWKQDSRGSFHRFLS